VIDGVWVDHLRRGNSALAGRLRRADVWCHPFVIGELACGNLKRRGEILSGLAALPQVPMAEHHEVLTFVESHHLMGWGVGWIDAHLLASAKLAGVRLWTLDRALASAAHALGLRADVRT
jgi:hypothetical protein